MTIERNALPGAVGATGASVAALAQHVERTAEFGVCGVGMAFCVLGDPRSTALCGDAGAAKLIFRQSMCFTYLFAQRVSFSKDVIDVESFPLISVFDALARVAVAIFFMAHAVVRIAHGSIPGFAEFLAARGWPLALALVWSITIVETISGLLLIAGRCVRWAASALMFSRSWAS